jgi:hypothetical protein
MSVANLDRGASRSWALTLFAMIRTHYSVASATRSSGTAARRVTEPAAKFSGEMTVIVKAAGVGNLAERLAGVEHGPATHEAGGVI